MSRESQGTRLSDRIIALPKNGRNLVLYIFEPKVRKLLMYLAFHKRGWQFTFDGRKYRYLYHAHNKTWSNERAVELPILWEEVKKHDAERILEVGNVLSHYWTTAHDTVDKHEGGDGVITLDVLDFHTAKRYDLIISISTIEHVGFNEDVFAIEHEGYDEDKSVGKDIMQQPQKPLRVIQHLMGLLTQKGKLIVTIPLGYNPTFDQLLREDSEGVFTGKAYLKKISKSNKWVEVEEGEIHDVKYGFPFEHANVLAIYTFDKTNT